MSCPVGDIATVHFKMRCLVAIIYSPLKPSRVALFWKGQVPQDMTADALKCKN